MKKRLLMPMNLQLFAEGGSDNSVGGGAFMMPLLNPYLPYLSTLFAVKQKEASCFDN